MYGHKGVSRCGGGGLVAMNLCRGTSTEYIVLHGGKLLLQSYYFISL